MKDPLPLIDPASGFIHLPAGGVVSPDLTLKAFEENTSWANNETITSGVPWWSYLFPGGRVDGKNLLVSVHFYDQLLLSVDLTVSHYDQDQKDLSVKIEADTKNFHDRLLERIFGPPSDITFLPTSSPNNYPLLGRSLAWAFRWGTVSSLFVSQSCCSLMMVSYGKRREAAYEREKQRPKYL
jgi:hypothetical protein